MHANNDPLGVRSASVSGADAVGRPFGYCGEIVDRAEWLSLRSCEVRTKAQPKWLNELTPRWYLAPASQCDSSSSRSRQSYRRILVTQGIRRQRLELVIKLPPVRH
jgi:hypothetical protein